MRRGILWLGGTLLGGLYLCLGTILYQMLRQQGRLLLRLEQMEERLDQVDQLLSSSDQPLAGPSATGTGAAYQGLPLGTPMAPFHLPTLTGTTIGLDGFAGKQVLLVHWDPWCGYCAQIAGDLARLQPDLQAANVQLLLLSHGDAESNRRLAAEHGLTCPILLQQPGQTIAAFQPLGTPVAYLLDEHGRVARPLALGADQVVALARAVAGQRLPGQRPLSDSRIEREGLKPGTPAPRFRLPDLDGRPVALEHYQGGRVLLVFTDPRCGPCDALAPELVRLYRARPKADLAFIMVSRGDVEENRRKAEEHGIPFPVVIQPQWQLSKEYGIFATPVAFLINERGIITHNVARGVDEILALARQEVPAVTG